MKRIMFGNFRIAFDKKGKKANCEILDTKANTKFTVSIDENGKAFVDNAGQKVSKQETFMKALKRIYDMYDKGVA